MPRLLNYQFIENRSRQRFQMPWPIVGAMALIFIMSLGFYTSYLLIAGNNKQASLASLQKKEVRLRKQLQESFPKGLIASLTPQQSAMLAGFHGYFAFMSSFDISGLWLNHITINLDKKQLFISGQSLTPSSVQIFLSTLSIEPLFAQEHLKITHLNSGSAERQRQQAKNTRRSSNNKQAIDSYLSINQLYTFNISDASGVKR